MSAQIETRPLPATIADLSIDEALEALASVEAAGDRVRAELEQIMRDRTDLRTQIGLLMEQQGAKRFEAFGWRARFEYKKTGSASVYEPAALRAQLLAQGIVPEKEIDAALPVVTAPPIVKPDLRKVRKLAEFGNAAAHVITAHINEPQAFEMLVIEPVIEEKNVTGTVSA